MWCLTRSVKTLLPVKCLYHATLEVLTAPSLKIRVCGDVTLCRYLVVPSVSQSCTVFKTSETTCSTTQHHIPKDTDLKVVILLMYHTEESRNYSKMSYSASKYSLWRQRLAVECQCAAVLVSHSFDSLVLPQPNYDTKTSTAKSSAAESSGSCSYGTIPSPVNRYIKPYVFSDYVFDICLTMHH